MVPLLVIDDPAASARMPAVVPVIVPMLAIVVPVWLLYTPLPAVAVTTPPAATSSVASTPVKLTSLPVAPVAFDSGAVVLAPIWTPRPVVIAPVSVTAPPPSIASNPVPEIASAFVGPAPA